MPHRRGAAVLVAVAIIAAMVVSTGVFASSSVESLGNAGLTQTSLYAGGIQMSDSTTTTQEEVANASVAANQTSQTSSNSSSTIDLSVGDGPTVCPGLSGDGIASWNSETDACTLSNAGPYSPTLCIGIASSACVSDRTTDLVIGPGVAFVLNATSFAIYTTLDNYGVLNATSGWLTNYGLVSNYGVIDSTSFDNLPFAGHGVIDNFANGTIINVNFNNFGLTVNNGTLDNRGIVSECTQTNIALYCGTIQNFGTIECTGSCSIQTTTTEQQPTGNDTGLS